MSDILVIEQMSVRYGNAHAVQGVSFAVVAGTTFALLGANGAGKSSTLKAVAGLIPKSGGRVLLEGVDVSKWTAAELVRNGVSYVPEGREVVGALTVDENLALGGYHVRGAGFKRRRDQVLELFPELTDKLGDGAWGLSGGQQQMLAIGRALMCGPRILLLDEPSLGLSPVLVRRVFSRLAKLREESGLTILLVEQDVALAARLAHRAVILRNGDVVAAASGEELRSADGRSRLADSYLGQGVAPAPATT